MRSVKLNEKLAQLLRAHGGSIEIQWWIYNDVAPYTLAYDPNSLTSWTFPRIYGPETPLYLEPDEDFLSDGNCFYSVAPVEVSPAEARVKIDKDNRWEERLYPDERYARETILAWQESGMLRYSSRRRGWFLYIPLRILWRPLDPVEYWEGVEITPRNINNVVKRGREYIMALAEAGNPNYELF